MDVPPPTVAEILDSPNPSSVLEEKWALLARRDQIWLQKELKRAANDARTEWLVAVVVHVVLRVGGLGVIFAVGTAVLKLLEPYVPFVLLFFIFMATVYSLGWLLGSHPTLRRILASWRDSRTYWRARYRLLREFHVEAQGRLVETAA